jgi:PAS domain S-box-containing protein
MAARTAPQRVPVRTRITGSPLAVIAGVAAVYAVAARLALWMAIPPGYATAVWPAAGIGLICVLTWGGRGAAGVAIGSFAVNLATALDASTALTIVRSLAIAGAIATGATLQCSIGAALVRRRVGFPSGLYDERDIAWFFALGGPLACLASSTISATALALAGAVAWSGFAFHWWTWWVGDTIGVLVFAPLALLLAMPGPDPVWRRRRGIVGLPLVLGFAAVTLLFIRVSGWERQRLRTDFERRTATVEAVLRSQLSDYEEVVASLASFFDASGEVTRAEFHAFCARPLAKYPAIAGLSWNPWLAAEQRGELEQRARSDGLGGFTITEFDAAHELRSAAARPDYVPIYYVEPVASNQAALGFDVNSDADRRDAFDRARRSSTLAATRRIELVQDGEPPPAGVLLVAPVFTRDGDSGGALRGFTVGIFRITDVIDSALRETDHEGMSVSLVDLAADGRALYTSHAPASSAMLDVHRTTLRFGGRRWELAIAPTAAFLTTQRSWQAWTVLAGGLLFIALLGAMLLITTGRTFRLHEGAERFRALVEASAQIVWTTNADGEVIEDSPSWRAFTGQSFEQWRGWGRGDAIHPDDRATFRDRWREVTAARAVIDAEYRIRHVSGEWRWMTGRAVPLLDTHGELRGWVMSNTDITERRRAADQVRIAEAEREQFFHELRRLNTELEERVQARTSELTAALREREVLLQEIHHRVKNNLQVISSLMNMQSRKAGGDADRSALEECQTRVETIALIHEQLYQSRDYANVAFSEYTRTLANNVFRTMGAAPGSVALDLAIADVAVPVDKAIPCGLLLNELITNALKHAFPDGRAGELRVELARNGDRIRLAVQDNGVGMPPGLDVRGTRSLGLRLVNTLVRQLRGTLAIEETGGTRFELEFVVEN